MRSLSFALPLTLVAGACSSPLCSNETIASLPSSDGKHRAVMFMRECGATTDFTTQVSVDPGFFQSVGNALVADAYNGGKRGPWGGPWATMKWVGPNELLVSYDKQARVFTRNSTVQGVTVTYQAVN